MNGDNKGICMEVLAIICRVFVRTYDRGAAQIRRGVAKRRNVSGLKGVMFT